MNKEELQGRIKSLRRQILVHACIFEMGEVMMSRERWESMADELLEIQSANIDCCDVGLFDDIFRSWDGRETAQLPLKDERIITRANWLLENKDITPSLL